MANERILVVEDEEITAEDIKDTLEELGYEVPITVPSGEEAIEKVEEIQPDLILMDIALEGKIDGIDAAEEIKKAYDIPIIFLTAYSDEKTIERVKNTKPEAYILKEPFSMLYKPFKPDELKGIIEITLHKYK